MRWRPKRKKEKSIEGKRRELVEGGVNWRKMEGFIGCRDFFFLLHYKIKIGKSHLLSD